MEHWRSGYLSTDGPLTENVGSGVSKDTEDTLGLPLWGSNHIKYQSTANKVTSLYFKTFADSKILLIGDLAFIDGLLNEQWIYRNVKQQGQIFREITMLRQALKPFKHFLGNYIPSNSHNQIMVTNQECKLLQKGPIIYMSIADGKIEKPSYVQKITEVLNNSENLAFEYLFQTKVKNICD